VNGAHVLTTLAVTVCSPLDLPGTDGPTVDQFEREQLVSVA
jgi:hypothetical protein